MANNNPNNTSGSQATTSYLTGFTETTDLRTTDTPATASSAMQPTTTNTADNANAGNTSTRRRKTPSSKTRNSTTSTWTSNNNNLPHHPPWCMKCCASGFDYSAEFLEYDYTKGNTQPLPRCRNRGEYYIDSYNDEPWSWTCGTNEQNGIWCNSSDQAGTIMSCMVWILMLYSAFTVTALTKTEGIPVICGEIYAFLVFMSLACHAKTSFTDPGSVPMQAIPSERQRMLRDSHSMCGQCQTFKPPGSHHCRICNRCISRMDHHCPWMNNCVGAGNLKHFVLFLIWTWSCASYSLVLFGWNYFFCADEDCTFHPVVLHLVRVMTLLAIGAFLFTSSMLMNVCYGIMTGIGTIDRLKKKATNTMSQSDEQPIDLKDVFGIGGIWTWPFPIDPVFDEYDGVMGYSMPQRLDRERQLMEARRPEDETLKQTASMELPRCVNDLLPV